MSLSLKTVSWDVVALILAWYPASPDPASAEATALEGGTCLRVHLESVGVAVGIAWHLCVGSDVFGKAAGRKRPCGNNALKLTQAGRGRRVTLGLACVFLAESD